MRKPHNQHQCVYASLSGPHGGENLVSCLIRGTLYNPSLPSQTGGVMRTILGILLPTFGLPGLQQCEPLSQAGILHQWPETHYPELS